MAAEATVRAFEHFAYQEIPEKNDCADLRVIPVGNLYSETE